MGFDLFENDSDNNENNENNRARLSLGRFKLDN